MKIKIKTLADGLMAVSRGNTIYVDAEKLIGETKLDKVLN